MDHFTDQDLDKIVNIMVGFQSMKEINKKFTDEIARRKEMANLNFEDCESCKL